MCYNWTESINILYAEDVINKRASENPCHSQAYKTKAGLVGVFLPSTIA